MTTEILLAIVGIVAVPLTSWLTSVLLRWKHNAEIDKLRVEVDKMRSEVRSSELTNVKLGNEIIMEQIVKPLEVQIKRLNTNVGRLEKAIAKISTCPYSAQCPVSIELLSAEKDTEHAAGTGK